MQRLPPCAKLWLLTHLSHEARETHCTQGIAPCSWQALIPLRALNGASPLLTLFQVMKQLCSLINQLQSQQNGPWNLSESCVLLSGPFSVWQCCALYIAQKLFNNELFSKVFYEPFLLSTIHSHLSFGIASQMDYLPYQLLLIHLTVKQVCLWMQLPPKRNPPHLSCFLDNN